MGWGSGNIGGCGGGLNFSVKQYATANDLPSFARENTIAIISAETMIGWAFDAVAPVDPAEGAVWIEVGAESEIAFNILKKNAVYVYPVSVWQYIGDEWSTLDAFICQESAWTKFSEIITDLVLYDNGTANAEFSLVNATLSDSYIQLSMPKSGSSSVTTQETYAMDKYTKCEVDFYAFECSSSTAHPTLYLTVRNEAGNDVASISIRKDTANEGTLSLPLALTGQHTIIVSASNDSGNYTASVRVTGIRLLMEGETV